MGGVMRRIVAEAEGRLLAAAVTAGYVSLHSSVKGRGVIIHIANSLDGDVVLSLDGGTTDYIAIPAGNNITFNLGTNNAEYSGTISVKQGPSGASTSGFISCGVLRVN